MYNSIVILKFAFVGEASTALFTLPVLRRFGSVATVVFFARVRFTNMAKQDVFGRILLETLVALPFFRLVHPVEWKQIEIKIISFNLENN